MIEGLWSVSTGAFDCGGSFGACSGAREVCCSCSSLPVRNGHLVGSCTRVAEVLSKDELDALVTEGWFVGHGISCLNILQDGGYLASQRLVRKKEALQQRPKLQVPFPPSTEAWGCSRGEGRGARPVTRKCRAARCQDCV